jgi:hypothetical protein
VLSNIKPEAKRIVNLIRAIRQNGAILPGDKIQIINEKPAIYNGAIEEGDIQTNYIQVHLFTLHDGIQIVMEAPTLNRYLGKLIY